MKQGYITAALIGLCFWNRAVNDPDLGWHLLGGGSILAHGQLPSLDFINGFREGWHDYHWLAQVIFSAISSVTGFEGLRITKGILIAIFSFLLYDRTYTLQGRDRSRALALVLLMVGIAFCAPTLTFRPHLFALITLTLALRILTSPPARFELGKLLGLTIFTANLHVYWIFIPCLWFFLRPLPQLIHDRSCNGLKSTIAPLLLFSLAGLATPYGIAMYSLLWEYVTMSSELRNWIVEMQSGFQMGGPVRWLLTTYFVLLGVALARGVPRNRYHTVALSVLGAFLLIRSVKFAPIFVIFSVPFITWFAVEHFRKRDPTIFTTESRALQGLHWIILLAAGAIAGKSLLAPPDPAETLEARYPIAACRSIGTWLSEEPPSSLPTLIATHFNDGGWCRFILNRDYPTLNVRVSTDGRTQGMPISHFEDGRELYYLRPKWREVLTRWNPSAIVTKKKQPLHQGLLEGEEWKVIYEDDDFAAFVSE